MAQHPVSYIFILLLIGNVATGYAAFPVEVRPAPTYTVAPMHKAQSISPGDGLKPTKPGNGAIGILSFILGTAGLLALIVGVSIGSLAIGLLWPLFSIAAIVMGAIGLKKKNKGYAIAGLILGTVSTLVLLIIIINFITTPLKFG